MQKLKFLLISSLLTIVCLAAQTHSATATIWGTDATSELVGSRDSTSGGGITAIPSGDYWDNGEFNIFWDIEKLDDGSWIYEYTLDAENRDISHFILEVTKEADLSEFTIGYSDIESPTDWGPAPSNPALDQEFYGIKFDNVDTNTLYKSSEQSITFTLETKRSPVYGVFYAKDGATGGGAGGGDDIAAWSSALDLEDYTTSDLTDDYIPRPNGFSIPEPTTMLLLGTGLFGLAGFARKKLCKNS